MRLHVPLVLTIALAVAMAGCIQNLAGVKEKTDDEVDPEPLEQTGTQLDLVNTTNLTPPVARITVFAANGALLYKSTFQADDPEELVFVDEKSTLSLIASDSDALEPGATLTSFAWSLDGKPIEGGGRQASAEVGEAGIYVLTLNVTDSENLTDQQTVRLAVAPKPYDVTIETETGPVAGAEGEGVPASVGFTLAADESQGAARVQKVVVTAVPPLPCDAILTITNADGEKMGSADSAGHSDLDQTEVVELGAISLGDYTATVGAFACIADKVPITIVVTYVPIIPGINDTDDGHGHAH